jgi:ribosomal protein S12 methylthiotransferase accessory factor
MKITFPGGARVEAEYKGFVIKTDQPIRFGGDGSAPTPFDHFLASIGTCAGFYVHRFLVQRNLRSDEVQLMLSTTKDPESGRVTRVDFQVELPEGFPRKYERAIVNAMNLCTVKQHIQDPPEFTTTLTCRSWSESTRDEPAVTV